MIDLMDGDWAFWLAAADAAVLVGVVWRIERQARAQADALEDARHEVESDLAFLKHRLRGRRETFGKLPPIEE